MQVIAVYSEKSRVGKDTAADVVQKTLEDQGATVHRTAFADAMKLVCAQALGLPASWTDADKITEIDGIKESGLVYYTRHSIGVPDYAGRVTSMGQTGRDFIIGLAEGIRAIDPDFWVRAAMPLSEMEIMDYWLLSDLRFRPEAVAVKRRAGLILEIQSQRRGEHKNEDRLDERLVDGVVDNDGDVPLTEFQDEVEEWVREKVLR